MGESVKIVTADFVKVNVTNSKTDAVVFERKFPKDITILEFKNKLEVVTGGCAATMKLELFNGDKLVGKLDNNESLLGSYPIEDGMRIHVIDEFTLVDAENVEKFNLTDQQYSERTDTVRNFLRSNKLGKYDEEEMKRLEEKKREAAAKEERLAREITVGARCQVTVAGQPRRLGTVMFNGVIEGKNKLMIGVKFDEPLGVNDGTVNGKKYFECQPKYGSFVPPTAVTVGDFPAEPDELDEI
ncbi:tubulin-folding cofactor B [Phlebotomus argentipes]|uniref:tubulin-folding cofactor B n=1 Tax=Phlebotomus argentipes TaxID=94469 RepID=UPI002892E4A4|nr:tubulin-folding cofactor B [Phlebotomus argentipes]